MTDNDRWKTARQRVQIIALAVILLLGLAIFTSPWWVPAIQERGAVSACQEAVVRYIRQPESAAFTIEETKRLPEWAGKWGVSGHVDADRRYTFTCRVADRGPYLDDVH